MLVRVFSGKVSSIGPVDIIPRLLGSVTIGVVMRLRWTSAAPSISRSANLEPKDDIDASVISPA